MKYYKEMLGLVSMGLVFITSITAQKPWLEENGAPLQSVDVVELQLDDKSQRRSAAYSSKDEGPLHFAHPISTAIPIRSSGTWEILNNGNLLWRQRIHSDGAYSLNLAFRDFYLPASAAMFLYDEEQTYVIGPITQRDNDTHGMWWSPIIPSDQIVVEIQVSQKEAPLIKTIITDVQHDFIGFGAALSGSCNLDVVCGAEDGWAIVDAYRDLINSVGMYTINGQDVCTGSLINNVRNDCTPYFLTAKHCQVTASNAASVVVYWNYQQSQCRTIGSSASGSRGDGVRNTFNSGTTLLSEFDNSDMALLLLDDPVAPEVTPFFAGWDATGSVLDTAICIHHPQSEEKRISFDFDASIPFFNNQFYRVLDWDIGTTEAGSSGAPLFSTAKRIVGQLNGGVAACGNDEYDEFGMIAISWEGGGTPETSLKTWLDPDDTGVLTLDGRSCTDLVLASKTTLSFCLLDTLIQEMTLSLESGYDMGAALSILSAPAGVTITFSNMLLTSSNPNSLLTISLEQEIEESEGEILIGVGSDNQSRIRIQLLVDLGLPLSPILTNPSNGQNNIPYDVSLEWEGQSSEYDLEIYEMLDGSPVLIIEQRLTARSFPIKGLKNNTTYRWRVSAQNNCGRGSFSEFSEFTTGNVFCFVGNDTDLPQAIGIDIDTVSSVISITEEGTVVDVNIINVSGKHTYVSDLIMEIKSPSGSVVSLLAYRCEDNDDFFVSFDDDSDIINTPCPLNSSIPQRPMGKLSDFHGESATGDWTLTIYDDVREDGGSFDSWALELCLINESAAGRTVSFSPSIIEVCEKVPTENLIIDALVSDGYSDQVVLRLLEPIDTDITISNAPTTGSGSRAFEITIPEPDKLLAGTVLRFLVVDEFGRDTFSINSLNSNPPSAPILSAPANLEISVDLQPNLLWLPSINAIEYRLVLGRDADLSQVILDTIITDNQMTILDKLEVNTDYFWQVTAIGTCSDVTSEILQYRTTVIDATIDPALADIAMYPNPVSHDLQIVIPQHLLTQKINYQLLGSLGQVLGSGVLGSESTKIHMSHFSDGIYFMRLQTEKGLWTTSLVKY